MQEVPPGGTAKIKVKARLNLHGLVSLESATQVIEEEVEEAQAPDAAPAKEKDGDTPMRVRCRVSRGSWFDAQRCARVPPARHNCHASQAGSICLPKPPDSMSWHLTAWILSQDTEATAGDANMDDAGASADAGGGAAQSDGGAAAADAAAEAADAAAERPAGAADGAAAMETEEQAAQPAATTVKKRTKKILVPVKAETASIPDPVVQVRQAASVPVLEMRYASTQSCLQCVTGCQAARHGGSQ